MGSSLRNWISYYRLLTSGQTLSAYTCVCSSELKIAKPGEIENLLHLFPSHLLPVFRINVLFVRSSEGDFWTEF